MVSAHDVARELRKRVPHAGDVQTHKWLYYCQGWHLAWTGEPLFREDVEAWINGPVVAELWADEKHGRGKPDPQPIRGDGLAVIEYVVSRYGRFSGKELIRKTHLEDPWRDVAESEDAVSASPSPEITHKELQRWFEQDDEYVAHTAEVSRLSQRDDLYSFDEPVMTDAFRAALDRSLSGTRVVESRSF
jgi:uncharacterized phage-associated protein